MKEGKKYLLIAMHDDNSALDKIKTTHKNAETRSIGSEEIGIYEIKNKYVVLFVPFQDISNKKEKDGFINEYIEGLNLIIKEMELNGENTLAFLHGRTNPFDPRSLKKISLPDSNKKIFSGFSEYAYCLLDLVCHGEVRRYNDGGRGDCKGFPTWEQLKKYVRPNFAVLSLQPFLPLHLSLQAFFGISRNENGDFDRIGTRTETGGKEGDFLRRINEQRQHLDDGNGTVPEEYRKIFPKLDAFLLASKAEYDFYAEIGGLLVESSESSERFEPHENQSCPSLLEQLFEDEKILMYAKFKDVRNNTIDGKRLKQDIIDLIENKHLFNLCAILANIDEDRIFRPELATDMTYVDEIKNHKQLLEQSKDRLVGSVVFGENCEERLEEDMHSKWPKDSSGDGNEPDILYWNLVDQLIEWNKDGEPAKNVIELIETIAYYLEQVMNVMEEEGSIDEI